jgi:polyferredoxin/ferredoxin
MEAGRWRRLKAARILSQFFFSGIFVLFYLRALDPFSSTDNPFLRFDPLILLTRRSLAFEVLLPVLILLLLTLVLGRFFCGWVCPLGALIDCLDALRALRALRARLRFPRQRPRRSPGRPGVFPTAAVFLGLALVGVFFGLPILQFLHPSVWMVRLLALSPAGLVFSVFLLILTLHSPRFWCRHICPLGALYGLVASPPLLGLRIAGCSKCGGCQRCPMNAIDMDSESVERRLCILCFAFEHRCPGSSFSYGALRRGGSRFSTSRRRFLGNLAALLGGAALGGLPALASTRPRSVLLRPPGVVREEEFVQRCLRCLQCLRSCPNGIIRAAGPEHGLERMMTPRLDFSRLGCDYNCQVCQLVCPNEAIPRQALRVKQRTPIGRAVINTSLCVVYARGLPCIVCEELCPVPEKAIRLVRKGGLQYPQVMPGCIGCGMCEAYCPAEPKAIRIINFRSSGSTA